MCRSGRERDIAFLGGIINYILTNDRWFREYVMAYTNATTIINDDFEDTEDLGGVFSGFDPDEKRYDPDNDCLALRFRKRTIEDACAGRDQSGIVQ